MNYLKIVVFGLIFWLVPYLLSLTLYTSGLMNHYPELYTFIVSLTTTMIGLVLTINYYRGSKVDRTVKEAWSMIGGWLAIQWVLDLVFLFASTGYTLLQYLLVMAFRNLPIIIFPLAVIYSKK